MSIFGIEEINKGIILYANAFIKVNQREMFQKFCEVLQYKKSNMIGEEQ
mgnify:CR=1 FL=1